METNLGLATVVYLPYDEDIKCDDLESYSSVSSFDDDIWDLDLYVKGTRRKIYFASIPAKYRNYAKEYALRRLHHLVAAATVDSNVTGLRYFFIWMDDNHPKLPLLRVSSKLIDEYEMYLKLDGSVKKSTKEGIWTACSQFFRTMKGHPEFPERSPVRKGNPFSRTAVDRIHEERYIPDEVARQLDVIFRDQEIPLALRVCYWICRLIPSRIGEVITIPIECLRSYGGDYYILTLNMFKQNGGYLVPEKRMIQIKYSDMGKYLVDLIKEQQIVANKYQYLCKENQKDRLFIYPPYNFYKNKGENGKYIECANVKKVELLSDVNFRRFLKNISYRNSIKDKDGNEVTVTSHAFRHNAITDRIYENFNLLEIKDMTHHKTTAMIAQSYVHADESKLVKKAQMITGERDERFAGRIIANAMRFDQILKMPRSQRLGHIGVCSDATGCKNDLYECLGCEYFVPNIDNLDEFIADRKKFEEQLAFYKNMPYMLENIKAKISQLDVVIERIRKSMEDTNE
ncbi:MAG: site-specific integrase [Clostridiales bacterium]|nr:site-specific integrase [Clostridiales bacterium]